MGITERIEKSKTSIFKAFFSSTVNHYNILFGGNTLILTDEVAFTTVERTIKN